MVERPTDVVVERPADGGEAYSWWRGLQMVDRP
jgi:hypothetical protein